MGGKDSRQSVEDHKDFSETEASRYITIGGKRCELAPKATYVMQDRRGLWFQATRKPRIFDNDWTPNKVPLVAKTEQGFVRAVQTPVRRPWKEAVFHVGDAQGRDIGDE